MEKFRGAVLRLAREKAGLTLMGLSKALEKEYGTFVVDYTTLSQWEINPKAAPRKGKLKKVADFLGVKMSDLYDEKEVSRVDSSVDIISLIEKMIIIYKLDPNDTRLERIETILS